jgi:MFS family permease
MFSKKIKKNRKSFSKFSLMILVLVMVVNALSYGIIIPLLYPYASKFGIGPAGLGFLFASFSFFQLLATPIMGRLSDRYGRKPLLFISLVGTAGSLALFASATTVWMLFLARILDGVTGGNNSIAQAVIADTTTGKERAKGMGILAAAFGTGFVFGPAIGGLLSPFSLALPFYVAAGLALISSILLLLFLPETLPKSTRTKGKKADKFFDFPMLLATMKMPTIGSLLKLTLLIGTAHFALVVGFQAYSVDVLKLTATQLGLIFTSFGIVNVLMQGFGIGLLIKLAKSKLKILKYGVALSAITSILFGLTPTIWLFGVVSILYGLTFSPQFVMILGLLSESTKQEDQGVILGINQSVQSTAQIIGPLLASLVVSNFSVRSIFVLASGLFVIAIFYASQVKKTSVKANL